MIFQRVALLVFVAAALGLASGCGPLGALLPKSPAARYQAAADRYNAALRAANVQLASGSLLPAFAALAGAERAFSADLRDIPFPDTAQEPARRLIADSERLEKLYRQAATESDDAKRAAALDEIGAARKASSDDALQLRAALGLAAPATLQP